MAAKEEQGGRRPAGPAKASPWLRADRLRPCRFRAPKEKGCRLSLKGVRPPEQGVASPCPGRLCRASLSPMRIEWARLLLPKEAVVLLRANPLGREARVAGKLPLPKAPLKAGDPACKEP